MSEDAHPNKADLDWVDRILAGDPAAWNRFVKRYSDRIWRRSWHLCNEACPYNQATVFCVFHALAAGGVQPMRDDRTSCDEGLEIYAFIFDYMFKRTQYTGKLKHYDGRAELDSFVGAVLHGHLRTDWIRHKRKLRIDQITLPPEIQRLAVSDQRVFEQMIMQRPTETIARNVKLSTEETEKAQERVTHALMANGNLYLILRRPEGSLELVGQKVHTGASPHVLPLQRSVETIWECVGNIIRDFTDHEKMLLDMVFDKEMDAHSILDHCTSFGLNLPVKPRTGNMTIHTIYQSVDVLLKKIGKKLNEKHLDVLQDAINWLEHESDQENPTVTVKGLKALLKNMGIAKAPPTKEASDASRSIK